MKVSHILQNKGNECYRIEPDQPLKDAIKLMMEYRIGSLVVMENDVLMSIITERDIMGAVDKYQSKINGITVREMMAPKLVSCSSNDSIDHAMDLMTNNLTKRRVRHLPVVDDGKLVGLISIGDIVHALLTETKFENRLLKNYIKNWPEESAVE
jgi:CBS domain-containing protein